MANQIYLIGNNTFQNELMASFIETCVKVACNCCGYAPATSELCKSGKTNLILWDFDCNNIAEFWTLCETDIDNGIPKNLAAAFNVERTLDDQTQFICRGARGIFYKTDTAELIAKGIKAILEGKLWYSRGLMEEYVKCSKHLNNKPDAAAKLLSRREREVLAKIATGASNKDIADELCVSPCTIKTHSYKIFKKINVNNRMQATYWALSNLS